MTDMEGTGRLDRRLLIGPGLVVLGLGLLKLSDVLPFDRAQFGWSVPIPMILLAPGAVGVAARWSGRPAARRVAFLTGLLLAVVVGIAWFASTTQVGCNPRPDLATRLLAATPIPLVLGVGWTVAGWLAIRFSDRPVVAVAVGALAAIGAGVAMLLAWAAFFPGVTCVPVAAG